MSDSLALDFQVLPGPDAAQTTDPRVPPRDRVVTRDLMERFQRECPDKVFAVFADTGEEWTYRDLRTKTLQTAIGLQALGVKQGVLVNEVATGSAASQAGLRGGDVVTMVGKTPVSSPGTFVQLLTTSESPQVQLTLVRQKDKKTVTLRLTPRLVY
jgi:C-terminal processing protease CtpA/Prc